MEPNTDSSTKEEYSPNDLGTPEMSNLRTLYTYGLNKKTQLVTLTQNT